MSIRWAVFVSGQGTNLQNFLDLEQSGLLKKNSIVAVHSDRECQGLERAKKRGKPYLKLSPKVENFESQLVEFLKTNKVDRIFLLGYMRILTKSFLEIWAKPVINLHPSLLPKYPGLQSIEKAFEAGDSSVGVSLHEVIVELDAGPILKQFRFVRNPHWSLEELTNEVHQQEYKVVRDYLLELEKGLC